MAMGKVECEIEIKCSADKFWGGIKDPVTTLPKIFTERLKTLDVVEGDGKSAGTIWLFTYAEGTPSYTFIKERVEVLDNEKKILCYSVIDGEITNIYKKMVISLQVVPNGNGEGSLVKWSLEFEKVNEDDVVADADPNILQQHYIESYGRVDAYLLNA